MHLNSLISEACSLIDEYYSLSFGTYPQILMPHVMALIGKIEKLNGELTQNQIARLNGNLVKVMEAMQIGDHVLIRDYLVYEMKPTLKSFMDATGN